MEKNGRDIYGKNLIIDFVPLDLNNQKLLNNFSSGNDIIDKYFKFEALSDSTSKTFLVLNIDENVDIIAIYTLCCSGYVVQSNSKIYIYPAVEIKYFATSENYQDMQYDFKREVGCLSGHILSMVIAKIMDFTDKHCGANKVILYSVPDAIKFYETAGFKHFDDFMLESNEIYLEGCEPMYFDLNEY